MTAKLHLKVWSLQRSGSSLPVRAATVEHGSRKANPHCLGCAAPCCKAPLSAVLCASELLLKQFTFELSPAPDFVAKQAPVNFLVTIKAVNGRCFYLDPAIGRCKRWPDIPRGCQAYDCREDDRPEIRKFVRQQSWFGQPS